MPDLHSMRSDYRRGGLRRQDLNECPFAQFAAWFDEACESNLIEPNAMSLSTVGAEGRPSLRTVLLKSYDTKGFVFFTNLESRKAGEIRQNPNVALLFPWLALERQVIVCGQAQEISRTETLAYFLTRPRGSQIGAWVSCQSSVISSRTILEMKFDEMMRKFANGEVPLPSRWGGYRVVPREVEFWQGCPNRLHDRFLYALRADSHWDINRLSP